MTVYEKLFNRQLDMARVLQRLEARQKVIGCVSNEDDILFRTCKAVYEILHVLSQMQEPVTVATEQTEKSLRDDNEDDTAGNGGRCMKRTEAIAILQEEVNWFKFAIQGEEEDISDKTKRTIEAHEMASRALGGATV